LEKQFTSFVIQKAFLGIRKAFSLFFMLRSSAGLTVQKDISSALAII